MRNLSLISSGPLVLVILDGWGIAPDSQGNAISLAKTPNMDSYWASFPHTQLLASGEAVGLPKKEAGNSETGHMNIGSGRIVYQDLPRINLSIADGSFFEKEAFLKAVSHVEKNKSSMHLMGLIGAGGVHSNLEHLFALLRFMATKGVKNTYLHLFSDGRDSPPTSALIYFDQIERELVQLKIGRIASIMGRYYSMDRDNRWDRIQKAYEALVLGEGEKAKSAQEAIKNSYNSGKTDEFILPTVIVDEKNNPIKKIEDNDAVIFFNFRVDRPRELTRAFIDINFETYRPGNISFDPYAERYSPQTLEIGKTKATFPRQKVLKNLFFVTMTMYDKDLKTEVAFPPPRVSLSLSRIFSGLQVRQFHIAETEKYPHVSYFFDGMTDRPYPFEEWAEIPSPKVSTYDLKPEMSAEEVTNQFIKRIETKQYRFALINFANPDMVGHTGVIAAAVKACEITDFQLDRIVKEILNQDGTVFITADHGNVEEMINLDTNQIDTEHSTNPVPFIIINRSLRGVSSTLRPGILADIAPTILSAAKIIVPSEMMGRNLLS